MLETGLRINEIVYEIPIVEKQGLNVSGSNGLTLYDPLFTHELIFKACTRHESSWMKGGGSYKGAVVYA